MLKISPLLLGLEALCGCSQRGQLVGAASLGQLNVPEQIAVAFNHHQRNRYLSPISGEWRDGDDIDQMLGRTIELAKHEIVLAVQKLSAPTIADALLAALRQVVDAGLQIRLIADPSFASRSFLEVLDLLGVALPDRNCKLEKDNPPFNKGLKEMGNARLASGDKLHHKFALIDIKQ